MQTDTGHYVTLICDFSVVGLQICYNIKCVPVVKVSVLCVHSVHGALGALRLGDAHQFFVQLDCR